MAGPTWAIVVAAGRGDRFGGPKQFEVLAGRRVVDWSLAAARAACDRTVLVVPADRVAGMAGQADVVVAGGDTRSASVRAGMAAVPEETEILVVHDAARPAATVALFEAVVGAVAAGADGAVPGLPVVDTVKRVAGEVVTGTVDRTELVTVQTPQAFRAGVLRAAHRPGADASDDAALVEQNGGRVVVVPGDPRNRKVTTPDDLVALAEVLGP